MHHVPTRWRRRLLPLLAAAALAVGLVGTIPGRPGSAESEARSDALYTLEVTPTSGLVDGQAVDVVVRAAAGRRIGVSGKLNVCRADATYATPDDLIPFVGGKCPDRPLSSSASGPWPIRAYPDGSAAISTFRVGTGRVEWGPADDPARFDLTCDPETPCRLVVEIQIEGGPRIIDASTVLTFADESPLSTCGGVDPAAVGTGGPDRLLSAWIDWTKDKCQSVGGKASTQAVLAGEGEGHLAFASGQADLVYSAVGNRFPGSTADEPEDDRASVSVPIALNAAVVGLLGGYGSNAPDWPSAVPHPYEDVKVTTEELATLFGKGPFLFEISYMGDLQARNPELARGDSLSNASKPNPMAPAGADAVSFVTTSAFDTSAAAVWRTPNLNVSGNPPDVDRGVHPSLATAEPPFVSSLFELYSAQAQLKKVVAENEFKPYNYGPIWVLTDLATATKLGIPTVAVENAAGQFVRPTPESLVAAVPAMDRQDDGTYLPDVATTAADAYPLTFVEHAVAPAEPLLDETCAPRAEAQEVLEEWLDYLVGPGQEAVTGGLVPLPQALADDAAALAATVGTATPTGDCAPEEPPGETPGEQPAGAPGDLPPGVAPGALSAFGSGGSPLGGGSGGSSGSRGAAGGADGGAGGPETASEDGGVTDEAAAELISEVDRPRIGGASVAGWVAGAAAIVALAALVAVGGAASSGREIRLPGRRRS